MQRMESGHPAAAGGSMAATIDGVGWGLFFIWIGLCFLADLGWGVFLLGVGVLMLAGQAARRYHALTVDRFALLLGGGFTVAGLSRLLELQWDWAAVPRWIVPALCIGLGAAIVVSAWRRGHRA